MTSLFAQPDSVHTIQDALAHISQPQPVRVGQSNSSEASQQVHIEHLPPVLVLHLKRFLYDVVTDGTTKISKHVQYPPELEIPLGTNSSFLSPMAAKITNGSVGPEIMAPVAGNSAKPLHYKLHGVLYHHGESAGSGHYSVGVLQSNGDNGSGEAWLHIDDETVSTVGHEDVFGEHENDSGDNRCAYMLFYCRMPEASAQA